MMAPAAKDVLDQFDRLSDEDRRHVASEILLRTRDLDYPTVDDETMAQLADELFQTLDRDEDAESNPR